MQHLLPLFIYIPLVGFLITLFLSPKKETPLALVAITVVGIQLLGALLFTGYWLFQSTGNIEIEHLVLYQSVDFKFVIHFLFDPTTAVFLIIGAILMFLVSVFSRTYVHREQGFKRFFCTFLLFYLGYNLVVLSGNFETLFIGWEMLGISSFLLIAFYRDRYLPVKNGFKVLSIYRLGDICLILAMWMSHHLWHKNISFSALTQSDLVQAQFQQHYLLAMSVACMILLAAVIKSAQLPFSTWLPRAMEGPTSSSAIFYGALSVHIGVFLLLRTYPFWHHSDLIKWAIVAIGLVSSLVASSIASVQSSVKTQIAYASIAQIGLMFVEVALGFHVLALFHFAGNAFLRTYQLLVSPSVLGYRIHDMFFHFIPTGSDNEDSIWRRLKYAIYVLNIKEWNLDTILYQYLWNPFKWIGKRLDNLTYKWAFVGCAALILVGFLIPNLGQNVSPSILHSATLIYALLALLCILKAFSDRTDAQGAWILAFLSQILVAISIFLNEPLEWTELAYYFVGSTVSAIVGYACLKQIKDMDGDIALNRYHGYSYEKPLTALVMLLACLGLSGFPITPTFIGVDILFTHIHKQQIVLVLLVALHFLFFELALLRIYTRIFMGQHKKTDHPMAFKSS
jgi:NADH-quinone oxidoreductase subunit L